MKAKTLANWGWMLVVLVAGATSLAWAAAVAPLGQLNALASTKTSGRGAQHRWMIVLDQTAVGSFAHAVAGDALSEAVLIDPLTGHKRFLISAAPSEAKSIYDAPNLNFREIDPTGMVPEASTSGLILGGMALIAFLARRRGYR